MHRREEKYSFKNLQPLSYLNNFNTMVDHNQRHPIQSNPRKQLKTVSLTKFPLPQYYQNMEGIFQNITRKKAEQVNSKRTKKQQEEEEFMQNHNNFMRKVLTKFISHNQERQALFEQDKKYVKRNSDLKHHQRALSEPRLQKKKERFDLNPQNNISEFNSATKGSLEDVEKPSVEIKSVLPVVKPRKKYQKFKIRKDVNIEEAVTRKLRTPIPPSRKSNRKDLMDDKLDFRDDIISLQKHQASRQELFADKVEKQIAEFDKKMEIQIHAIKYYNFWKQPVDYDPVMTPKPSMMSGGSEEYAEAQLSVGNYKSK